VELEPRNSVINDHLGDAYWTAGRQNEARFQWQRALRMEPEAEEIPRIEAKLRDGLPTPPAATARRPD
jgi:predicted negative regulator of RcsB-dependent stress response